VTLPDATWTRADSHRRTRRRSSYRSPVYLATLSPTVNGGDSGELITVAYLGGVATRPGIPCTRCSAGS
jgi:hypothetical protein